MTQPQFPSVSSSLITRSEWKWVGVLSLLFLVVISAPYFMIAYSAPVDRSYVWFLNNPDDAATYLSKMAQGYYGSWLFTLSYSSEPHSGVPLFTIYILLGHIARLVGLPLIVLFHLARVLGTAWLLVEAYQFVANWIANINARRMAWLLAVAGGGLGWVIAFAGLTPPNPPDILAQPEAFPLQAAYTNAHFPFVIAATLWIVRALVTILVDGAQWPHLDRKTGLIIFAIQFLMNVAPYTMALVVGALIVLLVTLWRRQTLFPRCAATWLALVAVASVPLGLVGAWSVSSSNPIMQAMFQQIVTLSPPPWLYLIAFGPLLLLALIAWARGWRDLDPRWMALAGWAAVAFALAYVPTGIQRRFLTGIQVPLAVSATYGLFSVILPRLSKWQRSLTLRGIVAVSLPSTLIAIAVPVMAVSNVDVAPVFYLYRSEVEVIHWLSTTAIDRSSVVLASPELSLHLPVSGAKVVSGHHYETLHPDEMRQRVLDFYAGKDCQLPKSVGVRYVVVGPRERSLAGGFPNCLPRSEPVFVSTDGTLTVFGWRATAP